MQEEVNEQNEYFLDKFFFYTLLIYPASGNLPGCSHSVQPQQSASLEGKRTTRQVHIPELHPQPLKEKKKNKKRWMAIKYYDQRIDQKQETIKRSGKSTF